MADVRTMQYILYSVIPAMERLLPPKFANQESRAMLLVIGLQESRFQYRKQVGGPAHGFWQFEFGGGWKGVVGHPASDDLAREILKVLQYGEPDQQDYFGMAHNDVLACAMARLLLWTHPKPLPQKGQHQQGWQYYADTWRPGKPHRETWDGFYDEAWALVEA